MAGWLVVGVGLAACVLSALAPDILALPVSGANPPARWRASSFSGPVAQVYDGCLLPARHDREIGKRIQGSWPV